ncbi:MAG: FumA C-terminus/TtdB family hydratase beta subunit [Geminicoccaceae bacterium]|nr:FumA C-terminus/TtdB family hydratase beta subunit [Geminicoccaceae bacterium]
MNAALSIGQRRFRSLPLTGLRSERALGRDFLLVEPDLLAALAEIAFAEVQHFFRASHLAQLRAILDDPEASPSDRFVAMELLKNAVVAAGGLFPSCQDTGTATVYGWKGQEVLIEGDPVAALEAGIVRCWATRNLRSSHLAPLSMYEEKDTGTNLPARIKLYATTGDRLRLLFLAKGGGSANKTFLFQETKRLLDPDRLLAFLDEKIRTLGTAACPPYHLAVVVGGLSAEHCLETVKLASARALDDLPATGDASGRPFRDRETEERLLALTRSMGIGAQFLGKYLCHDVRVIRLPRHAGSLPVGLGVSCSADRQIEALVTAEGVFLEELEHDPARFLPDRPVELGEAVHIDLDRPMDAIRADLARLPVGAPVLLTGTMIVARDRVFAALAERRAAGERLPAYLRDHPIYHAGPARAPDGFPAGSFGPTTAARMDPYMPEFQAEGAALVTVAKGNRSALVVASCKTNGGFYLAGIGGAAAVTARDRIRSVEVIDFPEFGMEAVHRIRVEGFPAFLVIDDKGNDLYARG